MGDISKKNSMFQLMQSCIQGTFPIFIASNQDWYLIWSKIERSNAKLLQGQLRTPNNYMVVKNPNKYMVVKNVSAVLLHTWLFLLVIHVFVFKIQNEQIN